MTNLSKFSAVNKLLTPYLDYLENRKRLTKLKDSMNEEVYEEINDLLDTLKLDNKSFINQLKESVQSGTISTVLTQEVNKSDSSTEESDNEEVEVEVVKTPENKEKEEEKPKHNMYKKRLQFNKKKESDEDVKPIKKAKRLF